jgi:hypothetical protein
MAAVYENCSINISATRSPDCNGGCFGERKNMTAVLVYFNDAGKITEVGDAELETASLRTQLNESGQIIDVFVRPSLKESHHTFFANTIHNLGHNDPLLYRGWAFQERMLSPRTIHHHYRELIWECRHHFRCECGSIANTQLTFSSSNNGSWLKRIVGQFENASLSELKSAWFKLMNSYLELKFTYQYRGSASYQEVVALQRYSNGPLAEDPDLALISAVCSSNGSNIYGEVIRGSITMSALAIEAIVVWVGLKSRTGPEIWSDSDGGFQRYALIFDFDVEDMVLVSFSETSEKLLPDYDIFGNGDPDWKDPDLDEEILHDGERVLCMQLGYRSVLQNSSLAADLEAESLELPVGAAETRGDDEYGPGLDASSGPPSDLPSTSLLSEPAAGLLLRAVPGSSGTYYRLGITHGVDLRLPGRRSMVREIKIV